MKRSDESRQLDREERTVPERANIISPERYDGVVFELDGVVTNTVERHYRSWKETFDALFRTRFGRDFTPFGRREFRELAEGKPRREAIESVLDARNITLPLGEKLPDADEALGHDTDSVYRLERLKSRLFEQRIESGQLTAHDGAVELAHKLVRVGIEIAVVSASESAMRVLDILDLTALFDAIVDADTLADEGLHGKPSSDIFVEAASELGVTRDRCAIIESDRPAIEAGRGAGFGLIVVVAGDSTERKKFLERGADLAVDTLDDMKVEGIREAD